MTRLGTLGPVSELGLRAIVTPVPVGRLTARMIKVDVGLWLLLVAPFLVDLEGRLPWLAVGALSCAVLVVLGRRLPVVALAVATTAVAVEWRFLLALLATSYLAGRRLAGGRVALAVFPLVTVVGSAAVLVLAADVYSWMLRVGGIVVFGVFPWLVGRYRRQQAQLIRAGWERAAELEERQRIVADQARLRERARIAHDMHDSLGHQLSLAALMASSLEIAGDLDERHRATATKLRESIATATEQMRDVIDVLRDESDPVPMSPSGERIGDLVARAGAAGVAVDLTVDGEVEDLEPMRYRAAYRTVQEALTNATKHAPGAPVSVRLLGLAGEIQVIVTTGPPREPPHEGGRGGRGLLGLRERVRLVGGTMRAGPHSDGFQVVARIPRATAAIGDGNGGDTDESSAVAEEFNQARHRVRRRFLAAVLTPVGLGVGLVAVLMGLYAYDTFNSTLPPDTFHRLELGTTRAAMAEYLPDRQVPERGFGRQPVEPPGSTCEFYRSSAGFFPTVFDVYRLCFRDDRLVAKDVLVRTGQG